MKINGGKKYEIVTTDSPLVVGKSFEASDKKKFLVGEDIDKHSVLKICIPSGGVITTRNADYTIVEETFSGEIYMVVGEGLDSIELPEGASAEIPKATSEHECSGGVSSWNDLDDRPFYSSGVKVVDVLPETPIINSDTLMIVGLNCDIVDGGSYIVTVNGVEYECDAVGIDMEGIPLIILGNLSYFGDADTGEPFYAFFAPDEYIEVMGAKGCFILTEDFIEGLETDSVTVSISTLSEDINKLDNKYLNLEWIPAETTKLGTLLNENLNFSTSRYHVFSENPFDIVEGENYIIYLDGVKYECVGKKQVLPDNIIVRYFGNSANASITYEGFIEEDTGEPFCFITIIIADLLWQSTHLKAPEYKDVTVPVKIKGKTVIPPSPLPESMFPKSLPSVTLRSSTDGSTKLFKLIVDDSGTISATEVTE